MKVLNSSDEQDPVLLGIGAVVSALPQAALVVDETGAILVANSKARQLIGPTPHASLRTALEVVDEALFRKLDRLARSSAPAFLRLDFPGLEPVVFQGKMLKHKQTDNPSRILLVADGASTLIGKFTDPKTDTAKIKLRTDQTHLSHLELRKEALRLKRLSETDPLTGLLNVRAFRARVERALEDRPGRSGALVFVDLNNFKQINDRYGHAAGDKVLKHVAQKLTYPPQTWIATGRVGGDEFALWMPGVEASALPEVLASVRARVGLPQLLLCADGRTRITRMSASIGTACCPEEADNYDALRRLSDNRMYSEKAMHQVKRVANTTNG